MKANLKTLLESFVDLQIVSELPGAASHYERREETQFRSQARYKEQDIVCSSEFPFVD